MKVGDLVRFKCIGAGKHDDPPYSHDGEWRIGILIKYQTFEKVGTILYMGTLHQAQAKYIQKAGKED